MTINDIQKRLNELQDAYGKAKSISDTMQLIQICNNASQIRNYLILVSPYYPKGYFFEAIKFCNFICNQCGQALNDLTNKTLQDEIEGELREILTKIIGS